MNSPQRYTPRVTTFTSQSDISEFASFVNRIRWVFHDYEMDLYFGKQNPELNDLLTRDLDDLAVRLITIHAKTMGYLSTHYQKPIKNNP